MAIDIPHPRMLGVVVAYGGINVTKPKWTKGPWYADDLYVGGRKNQAIYTGATKENGKRVKNIESFWNARLISAAPELYEGVRDVMAIYGDQIADENPELYKKLSWGLVKVGLK